MGIDALPTVDQEWSPDDRFIIVSFWGQLKEAKQEFDSVWPGIELVAPVEKRMVRPRRKTSKKQSYWIERPLFLDYMAVRIPDGWERVYGLDCVNSVLGAEMPLVIRRRELEGMLAQSRKRDWEGSLVEIVSGPLAGRKGIYERGKVRLFMFDREIKAKVSTFSLSMV